MIVRPGTCIVAYAAIRPHQGVQYDELRLNAA